MPETRDLLTVNELNAWYGELHVLHGVTFAVRPGEVVTLLGRNGVGKTTTLKAIMGIIEKRSGSVEFEGKELIRLPSDAIARSGIAFCPEERGIFATLDVKENLLLPRQVRAGGLGLDGIFALFPNLRERLGSQGTKLSGGEQQMLAIARILRTGARLLLLDEPTEGLAPVIMQQIGRTIGALKAEGFTILLVEQNFRFAATVADRYYVMEHGRIVDQFSAAELDANTGKLHEYLGVLRAKSARMFEIFGIPSQALFGQLLLGLINGSFYALLSLGLAVIFGMLHIINFAHGAQYMMGAFAAYLMLQYLGIGYWEALVVAPILIGATGIVVERLFLQHLRTLDPLYGLLLTFGLALMIEGLFRNTYGSSGLPYEVPDALRGGRNLGFMFLPNYRAWVIVLSLAVCLATWFAIERTRLGSYLRAATENPVLVRAFGINVPRMVTLTYGFGVGLAALAGVMAAPIYNVSPQMGSDLIIVVFAVVVIGGMGSILGAILTGFALGIIEGLTKVFFPEASNTVIFVIMAVVLLIRPAGLFGRHA